MEGWRRKLRTKKRKREIYLELKFSIITASWELESERPKNVTVCYGPYFLSRKMYLPM